LTSLNGKILNNHFLIEPFLKELFRAKLHKNNLCKVSRRRARDRDETWDLRDRDSKNGSDQVSRLHHCMLH